jgi:hypothetical protein
MGKFEELKDTDTNEFIAPREDMQFWVRINEEEKI